MQLASIGSRGGGLREITRVLKKIKRKIQYSLFRQHWNLGVLASPIAEVAGLEGRRLQEAALNRLVWMHEDRGAFAADPFVVPVEGHPERFRILFEAFPWKEGRGRLAWVEFGPEGFGNRTSRLLECPYHLSYPFVLRDRGQTVLIPEQAEGDGLLPYDLDGSLALTQRDPLKLNGRLVDSTIFFFEGRYWLFATLYGDRVNTDLHLFHSEALDGHWAAHPQNPVKQDRRGARPGGAIFAYKGSHFRPAQDCSTHYGAGVIVQELVALTTDRFEEREVSTLRPPSSSPYTYGLHTISAAGDATVIDGARMQSVIHPALDQFGRYFF